MKKVVIFNTPPAYEDGKSTQQTVWHWEWWLTGRRNAHYQEEEWWSPPTQHHALKFTESSAICQTQHNRRTFLQNSCLARFLNSLKQFQRRILSISTPPKLSAGLSVLVSVPTCISHVMDFIKDDPCHLSHNFWASVQHAPQDLDEKSACNIR